jgi:hypothetical protein
MAAPTHAFGQGDDAAADLVIATLPALAGQVPAIDRSTPVPWEWLSFLALMLWLGAHSFMLGIGRRARG